MKGYITWHDKMNFALLKSLIYVFFYLSKAYPENAGRETLRHKTYCFIPIVFIFRQPQSNHVPRTELHFEILRASDATELTVHHNRQTRT